VRAVAIDGPLRPPDACAIDHDVNPAEGLDGRRDRGAHLLGIGDVGGGEAGSIAELFREGFSLGMREVHDHDPRPGGMKRLGGRPAET
jgi:hypothetical protein